MPSVELWCHIHTVYMDRVPRDWRTWVAVQNIKLFWTVFAIPNIRTQQDAWQTQRNRASSAQKCSHAHVRLLVLRDLPQGTSWILTNVWKVNCIRNYIMQMCTYEHTSTDMEVPSYMHSEREKVILSKENWKTKPLKGQLLKPHMQHLDTWNVNMKSFYGIQ